MRQKRLKLRKTCVAVLTGIILLALVSIAFAQVSPNYNLSWHVIGGGIDQMEGTHHSLQGTLCQTAAGSMTSPGHTMCSGFWCGEAEEFELYLPLVLRNSP